LSICRKELRPDEISDTNEKYDDVLKPKIFAYSRIGRNMVLKIRNRV
jgi:hypothetical protein